MGTTKTAVMVQRLRCLVLVGVLLAVASTQANAHGSHAAQRDLLQQGDLAAASTSTSVATAQEAAVVPTGGLKASDSPIYSSSVARKREEAAAQAILQKQVGKNRPRCRMTITPTEAADTERRMRAAEAARTANTSRSGSFRATINTYFHILQLADGTGRVTNSQVTRQMSVLNAAYASSGFSFRLRATRRTTVTAEEFRAVAGSPGAPSPVELAIKQARRVGGAATLNIYTWDLSAEDLLGFAKFPVWYATTEDGATLDGVVVTYQSLPGGTAAPTNLGDTLVHEVGHWLGLYHTFQSTSNEENATGCEADLLDGGDRVGDTPPEESPAQGGCQLGRDSCPDLPGRDPVRNYMDYSDDICLNQFTRGQAARMQAAWRTFRATA